MIVRLCLALFLASMLTPSAIAGAEPIDPAAYLPNDDDLPSGFSRIPDSDKTDSVDGATIKFRAYSRGDGIINAGVYSAVSEEVATSLYREIRDNYASIGSDWDDVAELGDDALSTSAFKFSGSIQQIAVFRAGTVTGMIQLDDRELLMKPDDAVRLARLMLRNGSAAPVAH